MRRRNWLKVDAGVLFEIVNLWGRPGRRLAAWKANQPAAPPRLAALAVGGRSSWSADASMWCAAEVATSSSLEPSALRGVLSSGVSFAAPFHRVPCKFLPCSVVDIEFVYVLVVRLRLQIADPCSFPC